VNGNGSGGNRLLIAVLAVQVVIAVVFIALVVTDALPIPGAQAAPFAGLGHAGAASVE
jgi:hypothetical protein